MIAAVAGVLLSAQDAEDLAGALDLLAQLLAERRSQPAPKLAHLMSQLHRATRKCVDINASDTQHATKRPSSRADENEPVHDLGYETVTTAEAARILGVGASAVRGLAQRDPTKLGSTRIRGSWRHNRTRVEHRALRKGQVLRYPPAPDQGV